MKVLLTTFYDARCTGLRILASCLKSPRNIYIYSVKMCFFKEHFTKKVQRFPESHKAYLSIQDNGYTMGMCDINPITENEEKIFFEYIEKEQPDIIGFGLRSYLNEIVIDLLKKIRSKFPHIKLIAGGYAPTLEPEVFTPYLDAVVRGEGEEAIVELCDCFRNKSSFEHIKNISFYKNGETINNPLRCAKKNISDYPWSFGFHDGEENLFTIENDKITYGDPLHHWQAYCFLLGRGCLGSCSYCSGGNWIKMYHNEGYKLPLRRMREIDDAIAELKRAKADGYKRIHFTDEYFAASMSYIHEFLDRYEKEIGLPVEMYLHYELINNHPELLHRLKRLGLKHVCVGIQSGDEKFAREVYNRKTSHKTISSFIRNIHAAGISAVYHLILGNPLETEENFRNSLEFLKEIPYKKGEDSFICFKFNAFPKSPIVEKYQEKALKKVPNHVFERQGCLAQLRMLLSDEEFLPLLNNKKYLDDVTELREIYFSKIDS